MAEHHEQAPRYVVTLYVEGGEHDGETFVFGPFLAEWEADGERDTLTRYGTTHVEPLYETADALEWLR